ncbi:Uncharacterised protein [Pseudomonas aeruginosa]|nr:Uncharacterised protein [Pseudomonas aeruginosa]
MLLVRIWLAPLDSFTFPMNTVMLLRSLVNESATDVSISSASALFSSRVRRNPSFNASTDSFPLAPNCRISAWVLPVASAMPSTIDGVAAMIEAQPSASTLFFISALDHASMAVVAWSARAASRTSA